MGATDVYKTVEVDKNELKFSGSEVKHFLIGPERDITTQLRLIRFMVKI